MKNVFKYLCAIILSAFFIGVIIKMPVAYATPGLEKSYDYLAAHQDKTAGGLFEEGDPEPQDLQTAWGAMAFAAGGYDSSTVGTPSIIDNIANQSCSFTSATDIERTILALSANHYNFSQLECNLGDKLYNLADPTTGQIGPDVISTIFGILAQKALGDTTNSTTVNYIIAQQKPDGGWDSGWGTESNITAQAILALRAVNINQGDPVIANAKTYLKTLQTDTGGIKYDNMWSTESDAFSDSFTLQAIYSLNESPADPFWLKNNKSVLDDINALRQENGTYIYSQSFDTNTPVWTTGTVLIALNKQYLSIDVPVLNPYQPASDETSPPPVLKNEPDELKVIPAPIAQSNDTKTTGQPQVNQETVPLAKTTALEKSQPSDQNKIASKENANSAYTDSIVSDQTLPSPQSNTQSINFTILIILGSIGALGSFVLSRSLWIKFLQVLLILCLPIYAYAAQRAGVIVRHSDGVVVQKCIEFNENSITGYQLLRRAGLNPIAENGFITEIDGEKAKSSTDPGVKDDYWSYWQLNYGNWLYSKAGATYSKIQNGNVDGWQRGGSDLLLPSISYSNICPKQKPTAVATAGQASNSPPISESETSEVVNTASSPATTIADTKSDSPSATNLSATDTSQQSSAAQDIQSANKQKNYTPYYIAAIIFGLIFGNVASFAIRKRRN